MGVATVTLADVRATKARSTLSAWGAWHADVALDGEHTLTGQVTLDLAGLLLQGTVLSGGPSEGRSFYRVVGGRGGWGKELPRKSYSNDAGVRLATVLEDAARECGEVIEGVSPSMRLGPSYTRPEGPAREVLELNAPQAWYVGEDGITRLGRRPTFELGASVPRVSPVDHTRRTLTIAPESLSGLVPGVTFDGIEAVDVVHEAAPAGIRTTLWGALGGGRSRGLAAFQKMLEALDPFRPFRGVYEYRVVLLQGERLDLQPVRRSTGMPDLQRVTIRPGVAGAKGVLALGTRVVVMFLDADPQRPFVAAFEDADGGAFVPLALDIDAQIAISLAKGVRPAVATGDLAGGIWPCAGTAVKVLV